ncbi:MAG: hypothetical protein ACOYYS_18705 [Chloroflexota bacterium]
MQPPNCITFEVKGQQAMQWLAWQLVEQSCWFQIMPLPDDIWQVTIENEPGLYTEIRTILDQYRYYDRPEIGLATTLGADALRIRIKFDQPEAKGELILETGVYGLHIIAPDVHPVFPVAQLDLFYQSNGASDGNDGTRGNPKFNIVLHSPREREDPLGSLAYYPHSRLTLEWGMQQRPATTVGETVYELEEQT